MKTINLPQQDRLEYLPGRDVGERHGSWCVSDRTLPVVPSSSQGQEQPLCLMLLPSQLKDLKCVPALGTVLSSALPCPAVITHLVNMIFKCLFLFGWLLFRIRWLFLEYFQQAHMKWNGRFEYFSVTPWEGFVFSTDFSLSVVFSDTFIRIKIKSFAGVPHFVCKNKLCCDYLLSTASEHGEHSRVPLLCHSNKNSVMQLC